MGLLNWYFLDSETLTREVLKGGIDYERTMRKYIATVLPKRDIILVLTVDNYPQHLPDLKKLVELELVELGSMESTNERLIANLKALDHRKEIKRAQRLDACLGYFETKEQHVHYFLVQLFHTLRSELCVVLLLERDTAEHITAEFGNIGVVLEKLRGLWDVEKALLDQMSSRNASGDKEFIDQGSFKQSVVGIFMSLVRGEHIIHAMDKNMRSLVHQLEPRMRQSDAHRGDLVDFIEVVFTAIQDRIHELAASDEDPQHVNIHLDIVNRPDFLDAVVRPKNAEHGNLLSEEELKAFVLIFRNWYNKMDL